MCFKSYYKKGIFDTREGVTELGWWAPGGRPGPGPRPESPVAPASPEPVTRDVSDTPEPEHCQLNITSFPHNNSVITLQRGLGHYQLNG